MFFFLFFFLVYNDIIWSTFMMKISINIRSFLGSMRMNPFLHTSDRQYPSFLDVWF